MQLKNLGQFLSGKENWIFGHDNIEAFYNKVRHDFVSTILSSSTGIGNTKLTEGLRTELFQKVLKEDRAYLTRAGLGEIIDNYCDKNNVKHNFNGLFLTKFRENLNTSIEKDTHKKEKNVLQFFGKALKSQISSCYQELEKSGENDLNNIKLSYLKAINSGNKILQHHVLDAANRAFSDVHKIEENLNGGEKALLKFIKKVYSDFNTVATHKNITESKRYIMKIGKYSIENADKLFGGKRGYLFGVDQLDNFLMESIKISNKAIDESGDNYVKTTLTKIQTAITEAATDPTRSYFTNKGLNQIITQVIDKQHIPETSKEKLNSYIKNINQEFEKIAVGNLEEKLKTAHLNLF